MAKKIGENLKDSIVYRPRELERRHDEAVIALQEIDTKQRAEELREKFQIWKRFVGKSRPSISH